MLLNMIISKFHLADYKKEDIQTLGRVNIVASTLSKLIALSCCKVDTTIDQFIANASKVAGN